MGESLSVRQGHIPVLVGEGKEMARIVVHTKVLQHPYFFGLLELAALEFGYDQKGILRIPCNIEQFHAIVQLIRRSKWRIKVLIACFTSPS